jgi:hypothetical protein
VSVTHAELCSAIYPALPLPLRATSVLLYRSTGLSFTVPPLFEIDHPMRDGTSVVTEYVRDLELGIAPRLLGKQYDSRVAERP